MARDYCGIADGAAGTRDSIRSMARDYCGIADGAASTRDSTTLFQIIKLFPDLTQATGKVSDQIP